MNWRRTGTTVMTMILLFLGGHFMTQTPMYEEGLWAVLLGLVLLIADAREQVYDQ